MTAVEDPPRTSTGGSARLLPPRRLLRAEVVLVFALSLGISGVYAVISIIGSLTAGKALSAQQATLNGSYSPRPYLDLTYQLVGIARALVPLALVAYLLARSGESLASVGVDRRRPGRDLLVGAGLAAVVGGTGLALYLGARGAGVNLTVVPESLPAVWWRIPVLVLSAAENAVLEEVLVVGYLLRRLSQLGWGRNRALLASATLRGSYHLYQGFGGFAGNFVMGLLLGRIYQRWGRTVPLAVAHTLIDSVAFVGYALLVGKVGWLPRPP